MLECRATRLGKVVVETGDLRHAADTNAIAEPRDGDLVGLVHDRRYRRARLVDDRHGDGVALHGIDGQAKAERL
ncbi:hypothetical protein D3C71_1785970 [compost metagenome]